MSEFDYGNARLRAMKSRLLSRRTLENLSEAGSVQGLITALSNTHYRQAVEAALTQVAERGSMDCLNEALRNDLVAVASRARRFFSDRAGELVALVLRRYDVHNVKTVLRGLARQAPANEILAAALPVGDLRVAELKELTWVASVREAIDLLATWRIALARPLLALRAKGREKSAELPEMELALERWHLSTALEIARAEGETGRSWLETLMLEADAVNIITALRLVGATPDRYDRNQVAALFVGPGHIPVSHLMKAIRKTSIGEAVSTLAEKRYRAALIEAQEQYVAAGRLSVFERALTRRQVEQAARLVTRDPLGLSVALGYMALKTNEITNLRLIAHGLMIGERPDRIRGELIFMN